MTTKKNKLWPILAFFIPVALMMLIYVCIGILPTGEKTVLTIDLNTQYIAFFSYLREMLTGDRGFFYSFSKTLGGDMAGLNAYYLMSPFNLLLLLFSTEQLPIAVEIITLLKIGLCGLAFYLCITKNKTWHGLIFSTSYALMAYNIVYQQNIMWLDSVILLPLLVLGIQRIIKERTPFLYLFSLFGCIVTNYYLGFMICIFSALFFLYQYLCCTEKQNKNIAVLFQYGASSILGGGLGMYVILPALKSLQGGKAVFDISMLTMSKVFPLRDFLSKIFIGSFDYGQIVTGQPHRYIPLPNIYCGMIVLVFAGIFFLNKKIQIQKRLGMFFLLTILLASFYLKGLNMIWHGFNEPTWFPFRFSFLFSFLLIYAGWHGYCAAEKVSIRYNFVSQVMIYIFLLICVFLTWNRPYDFLMPQKYLVSICIATTGGIIFLLYLKTQKQSLFLMLLLLGCTELFINGHLSLSVFNYADYGDYVAQVQEAEPAINYIKQHDNDFFRMEKTFGRKECDPMLLNYKGLSHYSSCEKNHIKYFMGQLGFRNNGNWAYYNRGSTYAADSLLAVKYLCSETELGYPYELQETIGKVKIYKNPYALPFGFMADDSVLDVSIDNPHKFQLQNELWNSMENSIGKDLFFPEKLSDIQLINMEKSQDSPYTYNKIDPDHLGSVVYTFTAQTDNPVFAWFGTETMKAAKIYVNGKLLGKYFDPHYYDILRLGNFKKSENVKIEIFPLTNSLSLTDAWVYYQDMNVTKDYFRLLSQEGLKLEVASDDFLSGVVNNISGKNLLFLTIPFDNGWKIFVDGKETSAKSAMGVFMSVEIPEGKHQITLKFEAPGLKQGILISSICGVTILIWVFLHRTKKRMKNK